MKVTVVRAGQDGSGTYRVDEPARALREAGADVEIEVVEDLDVEAVKFHDGRVEVRTVALDGVDVLVLQRPLRQSVNEVAKAAHRQDIKVIVDIDDDFHNVHRKHAAVGAIDPTLDRWHNKHWLFETARLADLVVVSTPALLKYASPGKGVVVRNRLPERILKVDAHDPPQAIGWTGWLKSHPADMTRAKGVLDLTDLPLRVVGSDEGVARALGVAPDRVQLAAPWTKPIDAYWQTVANSFTVGIAPLEISKFNQSKSALKNLEYLSLGIPFVASPTSEYRRIVNESSAGFLATSARTWANGVVRCLDAWDELSARGRAWAADQTLEEHVGEWESAWRKVLT